MGLTSGLDAAVMFPVRLKWKQDARRRDVMRKALCYIPVLESVAALELVMAFGVFLLFAGGLSRAVKLKGL